MMVRGNKRLLTLIYYHLLRNGYVSAARELKSECGVNFSFPKVLLTDVFQGWINSRKKTKNKDALAETSLDLDLFDSSALSADGENEFSSSMVLSEGASPVVKHIKGSAKKVKVESVTLKKRNSANKRASKVKGIRKMEVSSQDDSAVGSEALPGSSDDFENMVPPKAVVETEPASKSTPTSHRKSKISSATDGEQSKQAKSARAKTPTAAAKNRLLGSNGKSKVKEDVESSESSDETDIEEMAKSAHAKSTAAAKNRLPGSNGKSEVKDVESSESSDETDIEKILAVETPSKDAKETSSESDTSESEEEPEKQQKVLPVASSPKAKALPTPAEDSSGTDDSDSDEEPLSKRIGSQTSTIKTPSKDATTGKSQTPLPTQAPAADSSETDEQDSEKELPVSKMTSPLPASSVKTPSVGANGAGEKAAADDSSESDDSDSDEDQEVKKTASPLRASGVKTPSTGVKSPVAMAAKAKTILPADDGSETEDSDTYESFMAHPATTGKPIAKSTALTPAFTDGTAAGRTSTWIVIDENSKELYDDEPRSTMKASTLTAGAPSVKSPAATTVYVPDSDADSESSDSSDLEEKTAPIVQVAAVSLNKIAGSPSRSATKKTPATSKATVGQKKKAVDTSATSESSDEDLPSAQNKWNDILSDCSLDLMGLVVKHEAKKLQALESDITETTERLLAYKHRQSYKEMELKLGTHLRKLADSITNTKISKNHRDSEDYTMGMAYQWKCRASRPNSSSKHSQLQKPQQHVSFRLSEQEHMTDYSTDGSSPSASRGARRDNRNGAEDLTSKSNAGQEAGSLANHRRYLTQHRRLQTPISSVTAKHKATKLSEAVAKNKAQSPAKAVTDPKPAAADESSDSGNSSDSEQEPTKIQAPISSVTAKHKATKLSEAVAKNKARSPAQAVTDPKPAAADESSDSSDSSDSEQEPAKIQTPISSATAKHKATKPSEAVAKNKARSPAKAVTDPKPAAAAGSSDSSDSSDSEQEPAKIQTPISSVTAKLKATKPSEAVAKNKARSPAKAVTDPKPAAADESSDSSDSSDSEQEPAKIQTPISSVTAKLKATKPSEAVANNKARSPAKAVTDPKPAAADESSDSSDSSDSEQEPAKIQTPISSLTAKQKATKPSEAVAKNKARSPAKAVTDPKPAAADESSDSGDSSDSEQEPAKIQTPISSVTAKHKATKLSVAVAKNKARSPAKAVTDPKPAAAAGSSDSSDSSDSEQEPAKIQTPISSVTAKHKATKPSEAVAKNKARSPAKAVTDPKPAAADESSDSSDSSDSEQEPAKIQTPISSVTAKHKATKPSEAVAKNKARSPAMAVTDPKPAAAAESSDSGDSSDSEQEPAKIQTPISSVTAKHKATKPSEAVAKNKARSPAKAVTDPKPAAADESSDSSDSSDSEQEPAKIQTPIRSVTAKHKATKLSEAVAKNKARSPAKAVTDPKPAAAAGSSDSSDSSDSEQEPAKIQKTALMKAKASSLTPLLKSTPSIVSPANGKAELPAKTVKTGQVSATKGKTKETKEVGTPASAPKAEAEKRAGSTTKKPKASKVGKVKSAGQDKAAVVPTQEVTKGSSESSEISSSDEEASMKLHSSLQPNSKATDGKVLGDGLSKPGKGDISVDVSGIGEPAESQSVLQSPTKQSAVKRKLDLNHVENSTNAKPIKKSKVEKQPETVPSPSTPKALLKSQEETVLAPSEGSSKKAKKTSKKTLAAASPTTKISNVLETLSTPHTLSKDKKAKKIEATSPATPKLSQSSEKKSSKKRKSSSEAGDSKQKKKKLKAASPLPSKEKKKKSKKDKKKKDKKEKEAKKLSESLLKVGESTDSGVSLQSKPKKQKKVKSGKKTD